MDTINLNILRFIRENPGTSKLSVSEAFHISEYRLNRALRGLKREFPDIAFPWSHEHGLWLVQLDRSLLSWEWYGRKKETTAISSALKAQHFLTEDVTPILYVKVRR